MQRQQQIHLGRLIVFHVKAVTKRPAPRFEVGQEVTLNPLPHDPSPANSASGWYAVGRVAIAVMSLIVDPTAA